MASVDFKIDFVAELFFLLIFTIDERYEQQKNNSSPLAAVGIILLFAQRHNDVLKKHYHQALKDKGKLHLIIQYTELYPTLTSDKHLW